jgi:hypothetical protein
MDSTQQTRRRLAGQVLDDLVLLNELISLRNPTKPRVRLFAGALRRLLYEGLIYKVPGFVDDSLTLPTVDLTHIERLAEDGVISFYHVGRPTGSRGPLFVIGSRPQNSDLLPPAPLDELVQLPKPIELKVSRYLQQRCVVWEGVFVTRMQLLVFIAHKDGGVHFEAEPQGRGNLPMDVIRAINGVQGVASVFVDDPNNDSWVITAHVPYSPAGPAPQRYRPYELDPVDVSYLAMAGDLVNSSSVQNLQAALHTFLHSVG